MKMDKTKVLAVLLTLVIAVAVVFAIGYANRYSETDFDTKVVEVKDAVETEYEAQLEEIEVLFQGQIDAKVAEYEETLSEKDSLVTNLEADLAVKTEELEAKEAELITASEVILVDRYEIDELSLMDSNTYVVDNGDLEKLGDYEIEFDGEDIDVVETLELSGAFAGNDKDFDGNILFKLSDGDVEYKVSFSEDLTALDYSEDTVEFMFLGEDFEVSKWKTDSVVIRADADKAMAEGDMELDVTVVRIGEDSVLLNYLGDIQAVKSGETYEFDGVEVKVENIFYDSEGVDSLAFLQISEDLKLVIEDGDEYEADDNYEWIIGKDYIGLVLVEDFDEDDSALAEGEFFALPSDFLKVSFELDSVDYQTLNIEYESSNEINFEADFEDAEGNVVFDGAKFVDEDDDSYGTEVFFKDSDLSLKYSGSKNVFVIDGVRVGYDISSVKVDGEVYTNSDVNVISSNGFIVIAPEDDLEDGELSIEVPEEVVELTLIVE